MISSTVSSQAGVSRPTKRLTDSRVLRLQIARPIPAWKRRLDILCVVLTLPLWLPLMVLITLWIKLVSAGPVFFRQKRIGYHGEPFMIFKFRSMKANAETCSHEQHTLRLIRSGGPMTKLDSLDRRIIPGGRLLRATGLDELPQLFNVLAGNMSLVGPRPCLPHEFEGYDHYQRARVCAPPGITGYWQVNGKNKTTFGQMIELDLSYAERMCVGLDLWIMVCTPIALLKQLIESRCKPSPNGADDFAPQSTARKPEMACETEGAVK